MVPAAHRVLIRPLSKPTGGAFRHWAKSSSSNEPRIRAKGGSPGWRAMGACNPTQALADGRMPRVQGMLGDPVRSGDGGDPPA